MSKTSKFNDKYRKDVVSGRRGRQPRRLTARGVRRTDPDLGRMGKALIAFALMEAEAEADAASTAQTASSKSAGSGHALPEGTAQ